MKIYFLNFQNKSWIIILISIIPLQPPKVDCFNIKMIICKEINLSKIMTFIMPVYERCFNYCGAIVFCRY